jgi:hypothetical protein
LLFGKYTLNSSLHSFLYSLVTLSLPRPNILLGTQFSNTLSPCSSLDVSDHSHPYKTIGKIPTHYILVFLFLDETGRQRILHRIITNFPQGIPLRYKTNENKSLWFEMQQHIVVFE